MALTIANKEVREQFNMQHSINVGEVLDKEFPGNPQIYPFDMSTSLLRGEVYITNPDTDEQIFMLQYEEAQEVIALKDIEKQMAYIWSNYQDIIEEHIGDWEE